ncbi:MAG: transglutaminase domain-containing protein [Saprospiraceae bacterium]
MKQFHLPVTAFSRAIVVSLACATVGLLSPLPLFSQNFFAADKLALNTPPSKAASVKTLSEYLCADQPDDAHKARALYAWVTLNIAYVDSTDERDLWATPEHLERQAPERVLQNGTAVCQGYANLFCALAAEAGLRCEVVTGLAKNADGEVEYVGHAWAAARISGEWRLFDPTWGVQPAGMSRWKVMDQFFMASPEWFVLKHLPDDPVWQLLESPVTERRFRESSDGEILTFLERELEGEFKFRDTLSHWVAMDSASRMFAAESRVLRFNGSNERVIFGLGQSYWGLFFELRGALDSLTDAAILTDTVEIDTAWFEAQIQLMDRYHARARVLFEKLETQERIEKAEKFYTPKDVAALLEKARGDMRTGVFEYLLHSMPRGVLGERQIAQLRYQIELARQSYALAERRVDCDKMANSCFEISHNRSLVAIQLAQRQLRFAQDLANDQTANRNLKTIASHLREARSLFLQAIEDCEAMRRRPPKFAFVEERLATARQGLLTLRTCEIRAERTALSPEAEEVLTAQKFPARKTENLVGKMSRIAQSIEGLKDSLKYAGRDLGAEFGQITLFYLQLENFALQFNLANLRFRLALHDYENALQKNSLSSQRARIQYDANRAIQTLREAASALDFLEDSGKLPASSVSQKHEQVNKLSKALRELADLAD